ncbi:MAG TPA: DUF3089 domain-containing protein, partial [Sphingomicrobium sp.]|nr:DUF3089 domain-containing protein [Sphingomicrobium sp.]
MCARRFLILIFILTLIFVGGAFALFQFGGEILLRQATPEGHFEAAEAGGRPDYSQGVAWIAKPGLHPPPNPAEWKPAGLPPPTTAETSAAVFYIHPTTYLKNDRWNAPAFGDPDSMRRDRLFVQSQVSAFNDVAETWAPRYRQAAYGA